MRILEDLEYPLPVIKADVEKIVIETSTTYESSFKVSNIGGGVLTGRVTSNSKVISFSNNEIQGNSANIFYTVDLENYNPGDLLRTDILISSNGGEILIPVVIQVTYQAVVTKEGEQLTSLKDFTNYCKKNPVGGRHLFILNDFSVWLGTIGFEHMEVLDHLYSDFNRERALDNFLILSKQKKRATLETSAKSIDILKKLDEKEVITETIAIKRVGWGHIEAAIKTESNAPWLKILTEKINSASFKDSDETFISYQIDKSLIKGKYVREKIVIVSDNEIPININVKTQAAVKVNLSRYSFESDDSGILSVHNNKGKDLLIEVTAKDNYIKFNAKSYFVHDYINIPFTVKITAFQNAQLSIKKQPIVKTEIYVKTIVDDKIVKKTLSVNIGGITNRIKII